MENKLFDDYENEWQKEWKDMPEFISENKKPFQQIIISFKNYDDVKEFAAKLGIQVTPKTNSTYYPQIPRDTGSYYKSNKWNENEE